jgi:bifunctional DNase/RNase
MNKTVIEVQVRAVLPTSGGCAVFLGNTDKVFIIYVDQSVGGAITMFMRDTQKERPLTHDLMGHLMTALGAKVERVIINDLKNATYYARMIIRAENELQQKNHRAGWASERLHRDGQSTKGAPLRQPGSLGRSG